MEADVLALCIATYRRPRGLARLLEALPALELPEPAPELRVVVVDNDPDGSARGICQAASRNLPWPLDYRSEPRPGIAPARNAALDSTAEAGWIAFLDDDERPEPGWLSELLRVQAATGADVVAGPVVPELPQDAPDWLVRGRFHHRRRHPTGTRLPHAFTNNVLFRRSLVRELRLRFDERWALMGCEDRAFFQRVGMAGRLIVWADEAVVREDVPPERCRAGWLIRRRYRVGNATSHVERDLQGSLRSLPGLAARGIVWLALGKLRFLAGLVAGRRVRVAGLRDAAYGAGLLTGASGVRYREYARSGGSGPGVPPA